MGAIAACCTLAPATAPPQQRPDFSGRWVLDTLSIATQGGGRGDMSGNASGGGGGQGGGLGLGPPPGALVIRQDAASITIVEHGDAGPQLTIVMRFDASNQRNPLGLGRGQVTQARYSTRWDGTRLVTKISRTLTNRAGTQSMVYREVRSLDSDGSMVVETTVDGRPGGRTVVYRRAP
jgi:hypothetical protein